MLRECWIGALLFGISAAGQQPPSSPQPPAAPQPQPKSPVRSTEKPRQQETCSIEGRVVGSAGEVLKRVDLLLSRIDSTERTQYSGKSDAEGRFVLVNLDPGKYHLSGGRRGYVHMSYGAKRPGRPGTTLALDPGQHLSGIVFRLYPQSVIAGRVLDQDGDPVAYAGVQLQNYQYERGQRQLTEVTGEGTNDLGEFRLFGLAPGRYYLSVSWNQMMGMSSTSEQSPGSDSAGAISYTRTYYPSATSASGAQPIDLQPGSQIRGVEMVLLKTRTVSVRGRVIAGKAAQADRPAQIYLVSRDASRNFSYDNERSTDSLGNFEFRGVTPGAYALVAQRWGNPAWGGRVNLDVGSANVENVVIPMSPSAELRGRISLEGHTDPGLSDIRVWLEAEGNGYATGAPGTVKDDGSVVLSNVIPNEYRLRLFGMPEYFYIKAARLSGRNILDSTIDFTSGVAGNLEIVLGADAGQAEGLVFDAADQPVSGAIVALVPDTAHRGGRGRYKSATTDQYGRFDVKGIAPGDYKLFAWEDIDDGAYEDPEFLKRFEERGETASIRERSHTSYQLKLIPAEDKRKPE
jgi:protocatechuate 3,4-dioxygenase beta subunit